VKSGFRLKVKPVSDSVEKSIEFINLKPVSDSVKPVL